MIEWLITDYHFIPTFFFMFLILFAIMSAVIMSKSAYANSFKLSDFCIDRFSKFSHICSDHISN